LRVHVAGAGPAGLYFAILLKRSLPQADVHIFERSSPTAPPGWGVVFAGHGLGMFDADAVTRERVRERCVRWEDVVVGRDEARVTVRGNRFSACGRDALLEVLWERCRELEVPIRFDACVTELDGFRDADIVVGADGISSAIRRDIAPALGLSLDVRPNRYLWLGTSRRFDAMSLLFRATPSGVFCAHAYPYSATRSAFIAECSEGTFERSGLGAMSDDESVAALESIFAAELGGHRLMAAGAPWGRFAAVRAARSHADNVVLLGDALHSVHFSIGSGTRLALMSAAALVDALRQRPDALDAALAAFDAAHLPAARSLQQAAEASMRWFERMDDHFRAPPLLLAWRCMTRSGRVDDARLREQDPDFMRAVSRALATHAAGPDPQEPGETR